MLSDKLKKYFLVLGITILSRQALSAECLDWFRHLAADHNVWILPKTQEPPNKIPYIYHDIPNSKLRLALPKAKELVWQENISESGNTIDVNNGIFGYTITFSDGSCKNSFGYRLDSPKKISLKYLYVVGRFVNIWNHNLKGV